MKPGRFLLLVASIFILALGSCATYIRWNTLGVTHRLMSQDPALYAELTTNLVELCESSPEQGRLIDDPKQLQEIVPHIPGVHLAYVRIYPGRADVECGGGFHHYGVQLDRTEQPPEGGTAVWVLRGWGEGIGSKVLYTMTVPSATQEVEEGGHAP